MTNQSEDLQKLIAEMAALIEQNDEPDPKLYELFLQHPDFAFKLVDLIDNLDEAHIHEGPPIYAACIFGLDICVAQLQAAKEINVKSSAKLLEQLMNYLAERIDTQRHHLSFWLPVLNSFYEVHVDLTDALKNAYFNLASEESEDISEEDQVNHLDSIRDLIHELSDLSIFDIAENFFAQSYAMPPEFFTDLIADLYSIDEGRDIALLTLLHPKAEVREVAVETLNHILDQVQLSSISLTRLNSIMHWYPESQKPLFATWIKNQRKRGVVFATESAQPKIDIKATEIDGSGAQGIFVHSYNRKTSRLCGLLLKYDIGIKDTWVTPEIQGTDVSDYYQQAFDENVTIRSVDVSYLQIMAEHFLSLTRDNGEMPNVYFLEFQELLGLHFRPKKIDIDQLMEELSIQITPFTQEVINESLQRSKLWLKNKQFTESWYVENPSVDKIVNHNCSIVDGVRVCRLSDAMGAVFTDEMELQRDRWLFHFLWIALWFKAKEKKNEKVWRDSFLIAYVIKNGMPLRDIPVMYEVCHQTVINSVETMQERRTHLSKE